MLLVTLVATGSCSRPDSEEEVEAETTVPDTAGDSSEGCLLAAPDVSAALGDRVEAIGPVAGGATGSVDDDEYTFSWRGCTYSAGDGAVLTVAELVDGDGRPDVTGFERLSAMATSTRRATDTDDDRGTGSSVGDDGRADDEAGSGDDEGAGDGMDDVSDDGPVRVYGMGERVVLHEDRIYVLVEGRAAIAEGETPEGRPLDTLTLEALGRAVIDGLA